jgi:heat shock protein HslJ
MCKKMFYTKLCGKRMKLLLLTSVIVMLVAACIQPIFQPESPLISGKMLPLVENRWRLAEVKDYKETVDFSTIAPVYITFSNDGRLTWESTGCNSGGFTLIAQGKQHYYITEGVTTLRLCPKTQERQYSRVVTALTAITALELQDDQLILSGGAVRIVLEIDNP